MPRVFLLGDRDCYLCEGSAVKTLEGELQPWAVAIPASGRRVQSNYDHTSG